MSPAVTTLSTVGEPYVSVPVLSKTIACARPICSMAVPPLTMIPTLAARLMPLMTATGTARINERW